MMLENFIQLVSWWFAFGFLALYLIVRLESKLEYNRTTRRDAIYIVTFGLLSLAIVVGDWAESSEFLNKEFWNKPL